MEDKKPESRQVQMKLKAVYGLDKDTRVGAEIGDTNVYLFKDGKICDCPFRAALVKLQGMKQEGWMSIPCGQNCQHFHIVQETKKVMTPVEDGKPVEQVIETGKIVVRLTCGSGTVAYPISNIENVFTSKPLEPSPLKIVPLNQ